MSAYEQRLEPPDKLWQYLLFAAEPYETIAFKVRGMSCSHTVCQWVLAATMQRLVFFKGSVFANCAVRIERDYILKRPKQKSLTQL